LCVPCTCCGRPMGVCALSPCCYTINCNIPNRPFAFCCREGPRRSSSKLLRFI
ncbi:hypothetical protein ZWY2020_003095, partial [Hordeum vulgare]